MKKLLFLIIFVAALFTIRSVFASESFAATVGGNFNNQAGGIDMTVNYTIRDQVGGNPYTPTTPPTVGHGSAANAVFPISVAGYTTNAFPSITWTNSCGDSGFATTTGTGGAYTFTDQDVHCKNTNSTISITATGCDSSNNGSVSWSVDNIGTDGANIYNFKVYKHQVNTDFDNDPTIVSYVSSPPTTTYTASGATSTMLAGLGSGTWKIAVKAYPPNNDPGISVASWSFTCGSSVSNPTNLYANATNSLASSCQNRVDFSWTGATPGTFTYQVQTNATTDPGSSDSWTGPTPMPSPATSTFITTTNVFTGVGTTYYWRVRATLSVAPSTVYYSDSASFTTPSGCFSSFVAPPSNFRVTNCYDAFVDLPSPPDPNWVGVHWTSAYSIGGPTVVSGQSFVDYGSDSTFAPGTFTAVAGSASVVINYAFIDGQTYYFRIRELMTDSTWVFSQTAPVVMPSSCFPSSNSFPWLLGYADCQWGTPTVHLQWNRIANDSNHNFDVYRNGSWVSGSIVSFYYDSSMLSGPGDTWQVVGDEDSYWPHYSNWLELTYPVCTAPVAPNTLSANITDSPLTTGCDASKKPVINFKFTDRSSSPEESAFWLEVSAQTFTGPVSTSPVGGWAVKILPAKSGTGTVVNYQWSSNSSPPDPNTSGPFGSGDANALKPGSVYDLVPVDGVTYHWRVKAVNSYGVGTYIYDDGTVPDSTNSPGSAIQAAICKPQHDLKAEIDGFSWYGSVTQRKGINSFKVGETVTVDVKVANVSGQFITTLPQSVGNNGTLLWFFYNSVGGAPPAACTATAPIVLPAPSPTGQTLSLSLPSGGLAPNEVKSVTVSFIPSVPGSFTAYADVAPDCTFADTPTPGVDPDSTNNVSGAGYLVDVDKFFEASGGDVGATGNIAVGVNSSAFITPYTPKYQSQYLLAAKSVNAASNVASGGFRITNYDKPQVLAGGLYDYFASKYKNKAMADNPGRCSLTIGETYDGFYYCSGDMTLNTEFNYAIKGKSVFFIDGNLNINNTGWGRWMLASNDTAVFVVKGDINVPATVYLLHGVFIARNRFNDCLVNACSAVSQLQVTGAVYADCEVEEGKTCPGGNGLNLQRYFSTVSNNGTLPSDKFIFDPKYLIELSTLLASPAVGWNEVAP